MSGQKRPKTTLIMSLTKKSETQNQKIFFVTDLKIYRVFWAFEHLSAQLHGELRRCQDMCQLLWFRLNLTGCEGVILFFETVMHAFCDVRNLDLNLIFKLITRGCWRTQLLQTNITKSELETSFITTMHIISMRLFGINLAYINLMNVQVFCSRSYLKQFKNETVPEWF